MESQTSLMMTHIEDLYLENHRSELIAAKTEMEIDIENLRDTCNKINTDIKSNKTNIKILEFEHVFICEMIRLFEKHFDIVDELSKF